VRHYELSLRKDDCALIEVERQTDAGSRATPSR